MLCHGCVSIYGILSCNRGTVLLFFERRVMEIQQMKREGQSTEEKEHELDLMILAHYGITDQEQQNKILQDA